MTTVQQQSKLPPGPGPKFVQAVRFMAKPAELFEESQARYGDVWTLRLPKGVAFVFVADPELAKQVFAADTGKPLSGAAPPSHAFVFGARSLQMLDGEDHDTQRKLVEPPFRRDVVDRYRDQIARVCEAEVAQWPLNEPVSLLPLLRIVTLKMMVSVLLGADTPEAQASYIPEIRELFAISANLRLLAATWIAGVRGKPAPKELQKKVDALDAKLFPAIEQARRDPQLDQREDVLAMLLRARYDGDQALTDRQIRDHLVTLIMQGHGSTASECGWAIERLVRHPDVLERLRGELANGGGEYLDAVVKETLRVRPTLALPTRRAVEPFQLGEWLIPPGPSIMINTLMLHRREDLYPDPGRFRPERFLDHPAPPGTWIPFGGGTRQCPGANFALAEVKVVLRQLVLGTRLLPAEADDEPLRRRGVSFDPGRGARVVIKERLPMPGLAEVAAG